MYYTDPRGTQQVFNVHKREEKQTQKDIDPIATQVSPSKKT